MECEVLATIRKPARSSICVKRIALAIEANARLAEQRTRQVLAISDKIATSKGKAISTNTWLDSYWKVQDERVENGDIIPNTHKQKAKPVALLRESVGMKLISSVDVRDVAQYWSPMLQKVNRGWPR